MRKVNVEKGIYAQVRRREIWYRSRKQWNSSYKHKVTLQGIQEPFLTENDGVKTLFFHVAILQTIPLALWLQPLEE